MNCKACGKPRKPSNKAFCSVTCSKNNRPKHSAETKKKIGDAIRGNKYVFTKEHRLKLSLTKIGKRRPDLCGSKNVLWRGGFSSIYSKIRAMTEYKIWKAAVMERDLYTCQTCRKSGCKIEVDHIIPFSFIIKKNKIKTLEEAHLCRDLWDVNNGMTLCRECHRNTETYGILAMDYKDPDTIENHASKTKS